MQELHSLATFDPAWRLDFWPARVIHSTWRCISATQGKSGPCRGACAKTHTTAKLPRKINGRKKNYLHFVENLIADVQRKRSSTSPVTPRAAAFALVGMINWIYQWYKPEGPLTGDALVRQYTDIFFNGAVG